MSEMFVSRNKASTKAELKQFMLSFCDADIREKFDPHFYTLEPLLLQLIRELQQQNIKVAYSPVEVRIPEENVSAT